MLAFGSTLTVQFGTRAPVRSLMACLLVALVFAVAAPPIAVADTAWSPDISFGSAGAVAAPAGTVFQLTRHTASGEFALGYRDDGGTLRPLVAKFSTSGILDPAFGVA